VEEELAREACAKTGNNGKGNYQSKDKKANYSSNKEVHVINWYTEYNSIGATYTQALERLLAKGKNDLLEIKLETEAIRQSESSI